MFIVPLKFDVFNLKSQNNLKDESRFGRMVELEERQRSISSLLICVFLVAFSNILSLLIQQLAVDLLNPTAESERRKHKLKRIVQSPNSYFMDVKCPGCFNITTVFSHAQTVVVCAGCNAVLCQPTGGKARLTE
jgi:small subunit ribosomal protein S27e